MLKKMDILKKPFKNVNGLSSFRAIIVAIVFMIVTGIGMYIAAFGVHNGVSGRMDSIASSLLDSIIENRELTPDMQEYFKDELDDLNFYNKSYTVTYKKITFSGGVMTKTVLGVSDNGDSVGSFTFVPGDIIHIDIESSEDTMITKVSSIVLGEDSTVTTLGSAEGCVK